jgi:uncharacterized RDD family membrane protein YckC
MTRDEHLAFCKVCKNQKFDEEKGIICELTNQRADFEGKCNSYTEDTELMRRQEEAILHHRTFMKTASQGKRFANFILDYIFYIIFCYAAVAFWSIILSIFSYPPSAFIDSESKLANYLIAFILGLIYYAGFEVTTGRTLAKFITKTKVVDISGEHPSLKTIIIRSLCRFIPLEPFSFLFGEGGWHDTISDTIVIEN